MALSADQRDQTLEQLDGEVWGDPEFDSHVVLQSHLLRQLGIPWVLELAIEVIERNPFAEGVHYKGDLMTSDMELPRPVFVKHPELFQRAQLVAERVTPILRERSLASPWGPDSEALRAIERLFRSKGAA